MSLVLFPSQPFSPREIDPDFEPERVAAREAGFETALVDHTRILHGDAMAAVSRVPSSDQPALYRGWMLRPGQYASMHSELGARGVALLNTPQQGFALEGLWGQEFWVRVTV
jgi:hypothetical protein